MEYRLFLSESNFFFKKKICVYINFLFFSDKRISIYVSHEKTNKIPNSNKNDLF